MINNVPSAEDLQTISLRLFFKAWTEVSDLLSDFSRFYSFTIDPKSLADSEETTDFWKRAQSTLQTAYVLIQQSQEIGLKALISEISPYLLLKNISTKTVPDSIYDFTDFQTVEASALLDLCNIVNERQLPASFRKDYEDMRKNRNKIYHLGIYNDELKPITMMKAMLRKFSHLYPKKKWLVCRQEFALPQEWEGVGDNDAIDPTGTFYEIKTFLPHTTPDEYRGIMQHSPEEERYVCAVCAADANLAGGEFEPSEVPTAYLTSNPYRIHCEFCDSDHAIIERACSQADCSGSWFSADPEAESICITCGCSDDGSR